MVLLTVHVVTTLGESYAAAGALSAAATIAIAVSGPWRGRLLDRLGLRRVVLPSLCVALVCWSIAPFVGYRPLLVLAVVAGVFVIPTFSITRQAVIASVGEADRRTAISLDSAAVELSFMIAPAIAVWAAAQWSTSWVLFATQMLGVLGGVALWVVDPPLRGEGETRVGEVRVPIRTWFGLPFLAVCLAGLAATLVLSGSDIGIVATMRGFDAVAQIGLVLALWGLGSLVGGLLYGAMARPISAFWLLGGARGRHLPDGARDLAAGAWRCSGSWPACSAPRRSPRPSTRPAASCRPPCAARRWAGTGRSSPRAGRWVRRSPASRSTAGGHRRGS